MLLFCHLCIGAIIGLALARATRDLRMVPLAAVASVIPDLVDKPLGYLLYGDILGHGRLYFHTLLLLLLLAGVALVVSRRELTGVVPLLALFIGLHQVMDLMWQTPVTWLHPFLGPFPTEAPVEPGGWLLAMELFSLSEWVFLGVLLLVLLSAKRGDRYLPAGAIALLILAIAVPLWPPGMPLQFLPEELLDTGLALVLSSLAGALGLWLLYRGHRRDMSPEEYVMPGGP
jgi:hypothetical protein